MTVFERQMILRLILELLAYFRFGYDQGYHLYGFRLGTPGFNVNLRVSVLLEISPSWCKNKVHEMLTVKTNVEREHFFVSSLLF